MSPETVRFFRQPAIVTLLKHCRRKRYEPGSTLVHRGATGDRRPALFDPERFSQRHRRR